MARHRDILVLCYHAVSADWQDLIALGPSRLGAQISHLLERGWQATTFTRAVTSAPADRTLAITFDDAFRSTYRLALPVLRRLGVPATMFVPTAFPDAGPLSFPHLDRWIGSSHEPELEPASWQELAELRAAGWEIGSHSVSHPRLTQLSNEHVRAELRDSKAEIERRLGAGCEAIAYPYGDVDQRVADAARVAGYVAGGALLPMRRCDDPLRTPRLVVSSNDGKFHHRLRLTRPVRALQGSAAWPLIDSVGRISSSARSGGGG